MDETLRTENEELLRQLRSGQDAMLASFNRFSNSQNTPRLRNAQNPPTSPANKHSKFSQERKNIEIKAEIQNARARLAAKVTSDKQPSTETARIPADDKIEINPSPTHKNQQYVRDTETVDLKCGRDANESRASLLMEDSGNLRRPKRSIDDVDLDDSQGVRSILHRSGVQRRTTPTRVHFDVASPSRTQSKFAATSSPEASGTDSSLLGYDWIAGMLENCGKMEALDNTTDYFDELRQFRRQNKEECVAREFRHETLIEDVLHDLRPGQRLDVQPRSGQLTIDQIMDAKDNDEPVFSYTVNERLFPTPVNAETENREPGTPDTPQILKISIPSYRLQPRPSRLQPHRRRSVDESDSFSLVSHCQVGFHPGPIHATKPAQPADLPSTTNEESARKRAPLRSEKEAISSIRRSIRTPRKPPVDLRPNPAPRVIDAMLTRKEMNVDPTVSARCEAVRRAGAARPIR